MEDGSDEEFLDNVRADGVHVYPAIRSPDAEDGFGSTRGMAVTISDTAGVYHRAGFGHRVERGAVPAVIVVDLTYGFTDPSSPTGADLDAVVAATGRVVDCARSVGAPVIFTTIAYDAGEASTLAWLRKSTGMAAMLRGSHAVEIDQRLAPRPNEHVVVKTGASAFFGTSLAAFLSAARTDTVIITGATTSGCVRATAVDAVQSGFPVLVPRECVGDRASAPHEASLFDIDEKYGDVISVDDALTYLESLSPLPV